MNEYKVNAVVFAREGDALFIAQAMQAQLRKHGVVSVEEYYTLAGVASNFSDSKWGWEDLSTLSTEYCRGWVLKLPEIKPLHQGVPN